MSSGARSIQQSRIPASNAAWTSDGPRCVGRYEWKESADDSPFAVQVYGEYAIGLRLAGFGWLSWSVTDFSTMDFSTMESHGLWRRVSDNRLGELRITQVQALCADPAGWSTGTPRCGRYLWRLDRDDAPTLVALRSGRTQRTGCPEMLLHSYGHDAAGDFERILSSGEWISAPEIRPI